MSDASRQPIWTRPVRGSRGPVPGHSRDEIVAAAIALADAEGLGAVSMRAVATALGTGAGSLYRYLASRDDLLDLMVDRVAAELRPYPQADGNWLDSMVLLAREQLAMHRRHRWLMDVSYRSSSIGPQSLAWFDECLRVMTPVRAAVTAKFEAIAMTTGVVALFARSEATTGETVGFAGLDLADYPHLTAAFTQPPAAAPPAKDLFERTVRSLLTGLLAETDESAAPHRSAPAEGGNRKG